ncbi:MAG TPA: CoA transferase [Thermomicrobiales bacterium]|jgi:crotonobetainyl-CoA:carnitine CoA-transferase CaiB-like acyl-CoA transferase
MTEHDTTNMPLSGIRVLDLGRHLAGPTCAQYLGDLGADVIKIENPAKGEDGRAAGPPFFDANGPAAQGESAFFLSANRNKRSLALDLKQPAGQAIFQRLAREADVVVENFRPGVMEALQIGYEAMSAQNPRIIYCAISGYGPDGPFANRPGLDNIIQGFAGLMTSTGFEGGEPTRVGIPIADLLTGLLGAFGILAALQARERTGRGQRVETSLLESMIGTMGFQAVRVLNGAGVPPPAGNHHPINAPYGAFRTGDGWVTIGATGDKRWSAFCRILDAPEWLTDPRFATNGDRYARRYELADLISEKLQTHTTAEWEVILNEAGIPCGPIHQLDEALDHPQTRHREMVVEREHPTLGSVRLLGLPVKLSDTPGGVHRTPPLMGEHTTEILRELGLSDAELQELQRQGVIKDGAQASTSSALS